MKITKYQNTSILPTMEFIYSPYINELINKLHVKHPDYLQQYIQNGKIIPVKKEDGTYEYIKQETPLVDLTESIAGFTAAGDLQEIRQIASNEKHKNYGSALLGASLIAIPGNAAKYRKWLKDKFGYDAFRFTDEQLEKALEERLARYKSGKTTSIYGHKGNDIETYKNGVLLGHIELDPNGSENNIAHLGKKASMTENQINAPYAALGYDAALRISESQGKDLVHNHYILNPSEQISAQKTYLKQTPVIENGSLKHGTFPTSDEEEMMIRKWINESKTSDDIDRLLEDRRNFIEEKAKEATETELNAAVRGEYRAESTRIDLPVNELGKEELILRKMLPIRNIPEFFVSKIDNVNTFGENQFVKHYYMNPHALENTIEPTLDFDFQPTTSIYGYDSGGTLPLYLKHFNYGKR